MIGSGKFTSDSFQRIFLAYLHFSTIVFKPYKNFFLVQEQEILKQYEHNTDKKIEALQKFMIEQKEELKAFDMKLVLQLDQKVADQQQILEQAGVPGFYVTTNPTEIKVQMHLLDFLLRLSRMSIPL